MNLIGSIYPKIAFPKRIQYSRIFSLTLLILLVSLVLLLSFPTNVSAIEYGGIGIRPTKTETRDPSDTSIFNYTAELGTTISDEVQLINNTSQEQKVILYPADSVISSGGGFACKQLVEENTKVGDWISIEETRLTIEPNSTQNIPFSITVPRNAEVGENNGCLLIQKIESEDTDNAGVNLSLRTGLRVAITVPGDINSELKIINFTSNNKNLETLTLSALVENIGNVSVDSEIKMELSGLFFEPYAENGGEFTIIRDQESEYNFDFAKPWPGGILQGDLTVTNGDEVLTESIYIFVLPHPIVIAIILVIVLIIIGILIKNKYYKKTKKNIKVKLR